MEVAQRNDLTRPRDASGQRGVFVGAVEAWDLLRVAKLEDREDATHRAQAAVEAEFADVDAVLKTSCVELAGEAREGQSDREVEARARLA